MGDLGAAGRGARGSFGALRAFWGNFGGSWGRIQSWGGRLEGADKKRGGRRRRMDEVGGGSFGPRGTAVTEGCLRGPGGGM